jgi:drug/metabolite transporter (DMT)-like permease
MLVAIVWGSSYLAAKVLVGVAGVLPVLALRYLVAFAALGVVCVVSRPRRPGRRELVVGAVLGVSQACVLGLETFGVARTTATNAGVVISLTIVFTPALESVALHRWLPPRFFVAAALAVVGICLLVPDGGVRRPTLATAWSWSLPLSAPVMSLLLAG